MGKLASKENFNDSLNGKQVDIYHLKNQEMEVSITNYGARVVNLLVPDKNRKLVDVVVGFDSFKGFYNSTAPYFGATIGRYANRIANGKFALDGVEYLLPVNNGPNNLHGGPMGFHQVVWDVKPLNNNSLQLEYLSRDGEMGFPGNLSAKVVFTLSTDSELKIDYEATTDKKTICNLTNHTFFNLNGVGTINDHLLAINADTYTPIDATSIPLGVIKPVEGTPFDFKKPTAIGKKIQVNNEQLKNGNGYDHNYIINGESGTIKLAAEVTADKSGITMLVYTTEPGVQFYGGNFMQGEHVLKGGVKDEFRTAFCLETQHFPDSPNQPLFPSTELAPGKLYKSTTIYKFKKKV